MFSGKFISRFGVALWLMIAVLVILMMIVGEPPSPTNPQNTPPFNDPNRVFVEVEHAHKYGVESFRIVKGGKAGPWMSTRPTKEMIQRVADDPNW